LGQYFAASFATLLNNKARSFAVVNRVDAHRYLNKSAQTDHDLSTPDILAKFVSDFGTDAILSGSISVNEGVATIDFVGREASGKELFRSQYEEKLNPILREDSESGQSDAGFYFAGLDGVTPPKCLHCPIPEYPIGQGHPRLEGDVVISVLVTVEGKPEQIRLIQALGPDLDHAAIEGVRTWRFGPSKDADGKFVPVRVPVKITFKMNWQTR
jgi:TonB family protein